MCIHPTVSDRAYESPQCAGTLIFTGQTHNISAFGRKPRTIRTSSCSSITSCKNTNMLEILSRSYMEACAAIYHCEHVKDTRVHIIFAHAQTYANKIHRRIRENSYEIYNLIFFFYMTHVVSCSLKKCR